MVFNEEFFKQESESPTPTVKVAPMSEKIFTCYGNFLMKKATKGFLLTVTLAATIVGIWGNLLGPMLYKFLQP
jgi:hypothetical protein